ADKITGKLTVSITGVNGMDAKTAGERGYMSISAEDFAALKTAAFPFKIDWLQYGDIEITHYSGYGGNVVIPSKIGRWPVTSIRRAAFGAKQLTGITIPNSVTYIGDEAFSGTDLVSVTIPNSVTYIGEGAFSATSLSSVTIPAKVELSNSSFPHAFDEFYKRNGKKAGTYVYEVTKKKEGWTMR
ncbi:MAG: leucine-rich repeat domain-containing protein, partial [Treponema sp.]|nr:leucine-rich repeat domain-containing protein [Treponema sp.]